MTKRRHNRNTPQVTSTCVICGETFIGHGHNAAPVIDGRCCDDCGFYVTLVRLGVMQVTRLSFEEVGILFIGMEMGAAAKHWCDHDQAYLSWYGIEYAIDLIIDNLIDLSRNSPL